MTRFRGYLLIACAALFWGGAATLVKHLLNLQYDPLIIVQTRVSIAFVLLAFYFVVRDRKQLRVRVRDLGLVFFVGICGVAGSNYFYYFAIHESSVATAILVQYTAPIIVALYATLIQRERLTWQKGGAVALCTIGLFFAVGAYDRAAIQATPRAILFAFIAAIAYAIFNIAGKPLTAKYSVWTTLTSVLGAATLFWLFINPPSRILAAHYSLSDWGTFGIVSLVSILLPYGCYFAGLRHILPTQAIITSTLEPVFAIGTSFVFLGATLGALQILGACLVLASIVLLQLKPNGFFNPVAQE